MIDFDTILKDWQDEAKAEIEARVQRAESGEDWAVICRLEARMLKPNPLPPAHLTDCEVLDEFCFFCAEYKEAKGRNSAFNDRHLVALFGELKRRNLFPE